MDITDNDRNNDNFCIPFGIVALVRRLNKLLGIGVVALILLNFKSSYIPGTVVCVAHVTR